MSRLDDLFPGGDDQDGEDEEPETWLTDILAPDLDLVLVGFNPGRASADAERHFAGSNNYFWQLLGDAGLTPHEIDPAHDERVLDHGIGITNIVDRWSASSADLSADELREGGRRLQEKIAAVRPRVVGLLGKGVYRGYADLSTGARVDWGRQDPPQTEGVIDYLAPNPSGRSTVPYEERLFHFEELERLCRGG